MCSLFLCPVLLQHNTIPPVWDPILSNLCSNLSKCYPETITFVMVVAVTSPPWKLSAMRSPTWYKWDCFIHSLAQFRRLFINLHNISSHSYSAACFSEWHCEPLLQQEVRFGGDGGGSSPCFVSRRQVPLALTCTNSNHLLGFEGLRWPSSICCPVPPGCHSSCLCN